jgi:membrane protease YdiL (CAAX protease family)
MMKQSKLSLSRFLIYFLISQVVIEVFAKTLKLLLKNQSTNNSVVPICIQLASAVLASLIIIFMNMRMRKINFFQSLSFLGLKTPSWRQLLIGFLGAFFYFSIVILIPWGLDIKFVLCPNWFLMFLFLLLGPGIYEQILVQGFIFRNLREDRTFLRAALISGVLFAFIHTYYLFDGLTRQNLVAVLHFYIDCLLVACPFAFLFERGKWVIWGVSAAHFGIDVNGYVFNVVHTSHSIMRPFYWTWGCGVLEPWQVEGIIAVIATGLFMILITRWWLPVQQD